MNVDPRRIRLTNGAGPAIRRLSRAGFRIAVVSNQSAVAHGHFAEDSLRGVGLRLRELLARFGVLLDGFFYCPHHPDGRVASYARSCDCRKPAPGLLVHAMRDLGARPERTWMVGDILDDIEAAHRAHCRGILFDSGGETEWVMSPKRRPDFFTDDFAAIAEIILSGSAAA
jgi:histidinol-phosphate phosphatase family protein